MKIKLILHSLAPMSQILLIKFFSVNVPFHKTLARNHMQWHVLVTTYLTSPGVVHVSSDDDDDDDDDDDNDDD